MTALAPGPVKTEFWEIAGWETSGGGKFEDTVGKPAMISPEAAARAAVEGVEHGRRVVVPGLPGARGDGGLAPAAARAEAAGDRLDDGPPRGLGPPRAAAR